MGISGNILVTGFASSELGTNASDVAVRSFMNDLPSTLQGAAHLLHFHILDANTHDLRPKLEALLQGIRPTVCVFVGQAPGRNKITLERTATNRRFIGPPSHPGEPTPSEVIHEGGPAFCNASLWHMDELVAALQKAGIPAAISDDAGNSLCNQILYEGLQYATHHAGQMRCGFVHIPALPQQVIERWPDYPFMSLELTRAALVMILADVALGARDA